MNLGSDTELQVSDPNGSQRLTLGSHYNWRVLRRRSLLLLVIAGALWASASARAQAPSVVPASTTITIAHFNDVYEIDAVENGASGGLARVATALDRLRRTSTAVVTTLGGDFLSPSALGTAVVDGEPLAGRQMVDVLNAVGLQWATLGNHEFDVSEAAFHKRLAEAKFKVVVSNATDAYRGPNEVFRKAPSGVA